MDWQDWSEADYVEEEAEEEGLEVAGLAMMDLELDPALEDRA